MNAILELCDHESAQIRARAMAALGAIRKQVPKCAARIVQELDDSSEGVQAAAAKALGKLGRAAKPMVQEALTRPQQRSRALQALVEMGEFADKEVNGLFEVRANQADILLAWAHTDPPNLEAIVAAHEKTEEVESIYAALAAIGQGSPQARTRLTERVRPLGDLQLRNDARFLLLDSPTDESASRKSVIRRLQHESPSMRRMAARGLAKNPLAIPEFEAELIELLEDEHPSVAVEAAWALSNKAPLGFEWTIDTVRLEEPKVKPKGKYGSIVSGFVLWGKNAQEGLSRLEFCSLPAPAEVPEHLRENTARFQDWLQSDTPRRIVVGLHALASIGQRDKVTRDLIESLFHHEDVRVQEMSLRVASVYAHHGVLGWDDKASLNFDAADEEVRFWSRFFWVSIPGGESEQRIEEALLHGDFESRFAAIWALRARDDLADPRYCEPLSVALRNGCAHAALLLSHQDSSKAEQAYLAALSTKSNAAEALGQTLSCLFELWRVDGLKGRDFPKSMEWLLEHSNSDVAAVAQSIKRKTGN